MATLKDVAKLASVDVSTVSRALNNTSYVHPDTKARIYAAVKELSYRPNVLARGLRQGKCYTIGVVIPNLNMTIFAEVMHGIEKEASKRGYAIFLCNTDDDARHEKEVLNRLRNNFVDGIIIAGTGKNGRILRDIQSSGTSLVQVVRKQENGISSVVGDYESCGYEAVKYLMSKGRRHIGLINGNPLLAPYMERYIGYKRALDEFGLTEITVADTKQVNTFEYGYNCASELVDQNPDLDAIMAAVDIQGMGAMRALKDRGILFPDDISLISLTGHSIGALLETTMTSLEMPAQEMGIKAASMLIEDIEAPSDKKNSLQHLVFKGSMTERESG